MTGSFRSVRGRLAALLLLGAIPVVSMAAGMAWQNYRIATEAGQQRILLVREAAAARNDAVLSGVNQTLAHLALDPDLAADPATCDAALRRALALQPDRYANLFVLNPTGTIRCSARDLTGSPLAPGGPAPAREAALTAIRTRAFAIGSFVFGPLVNSTVLDTAFPLPAPAAGAVVAILRTDWLANPASPGTPKGASAAWVIGRDGATFPLSGTLDEARPSPEIFARLQNSDAPVAALSQAGGSWIYAAITLPGQLRLVVGADADADLAQARLLLLRRVAGLAVLLGAGLAAVALGAHAAVVRPLNRLTEAVLRWRNGAPFAPAGLEGAPREVQAFAVCFADATTALAERERQLQEAIGQQELLMQEIHHRVKNNLQIIASLMNLQASRIRVPEARAEFQSARDRVRALATVHRHLYGHGDLHAIEMHTFLHELCGQLLAALGIGISDPNSRIRLEIEAPTLKISSDQAVPMALIVTEAVSNAAKYAFPGGRIGLIRVCLTVSEDESALLVIEDNGVGVPAGRGGNEHDDRDGIGIKLIRGFARQLGATLTVEEVAGTRYAVDVPMKRVPAGETDDLD
jgi:two-component sensor histidine kinase